MPRRNKLPKSEQDLVEWSKTTNDKEMVKAINSWILDLDALASRRTYLDTLMEFIKTIEHELYYPGITREHFLDRDLLRFYKEEIRKKHTKDGITNSVPKRKVNVINTFIKHMNLEGLHDKDIRIKQFKNLNSQPRKAMSLKEIGKFLLHLDSIVDEANQSGRRLKIRRAYAKRALFTTFLSCGGRATAVCSAKISDFIDGDIPILRLREKANVIAEPRLNATCAKYLRHWIETYRLGRLWQADDYIFSDRGSVEPYSKVTVGGWFKKECEAAGISTDLVTHSMRYGATSLLLEAGYTKDEIQVFLGHRRGDTTDHYVRHSISTEKDIGSLINIDKIKRDVSETPPDNVVELGL